MADSTGTRTVSTEADSRPVLEYLKELHDRITRSGENVPLA